MKHFRMLAAGLCSAVLLCGFAIPAYAYSDSGNEEPPVVEETPPPESAPTITPGEGFSEDGNLVTRDLLYDAATNKQFITVETSGGNTFYIVIDYDKPVDEDGEQKPYPAYLLSNNNANIRRVRQRIEELSSRSEFAGWTFPGGEAKINEAENRLQLIFEEKPDADQRQELKSNGFKWAPSQGAWQRQLNQNAIRAAARIDFLRPEDGTSPYQLQPFVKRENKEMSR